MCFSTRRSENVAELRNHSFVILTKRHYYVAQRVPTHNNNNTLYRDTIANIMGTMSMTERWQPDQTIRYITVHL